MSDYSRQETDGNQHGVPLPAPSANSSDALSSYSSASKGSDSSASHDDGGYFVRHGIIAGPNEDFASLFNRLAIQEGWSKTQRKKHRPEAITAEIDAIYGTDTTKLEKWQELCRDVKIEPVPLSITKCKKALKMVYCNLTNLINHRRNRDVQLILFPNYQSFRTWTLGGKNRSRIFPKQVAKDEGFIKALLRDLRLD